MQVAFGSPGHKGVTTLMAVGAAELDENQTDHAVKLALVGAVAAAGLGLLLGSRTVRDAGAGAAAALLLVRHLTRNKVVVVTKPTLVVATPTAYY